jgi:hypothetical protein
MEDENEADQDENLNHRLISLSSPGDTSNASWLSFWKGLTRLDPNLALV